MHTVLVHLGYCEHCQTESIGHAKAITMKDRWMVLTFHHIYRCEDCGYTRYKLGKRRIRTAIAVLIILLALGVTVAMLRDGIEGLERQGPVAAPVK